MGSSSLANKLTRLLVGRGNLVRMLDGERKTSSILLSEQGAGSSGLISEGDPAISVFLRPFPHSACLFLSNRDFQESLDQRSHHKRYTSIPKNAHGNRKISRRSSYCRSDGTSCETSTLSFDDEQMSLRFNGFLLKLRFFFPGGGRDESCVSRRKARPGARPDQEIAVKKGGTCHVS